jgi:zinc protease
LFPQVAKFEAERMRRLQLTPEVFATERGAVVSERKMRTEDSPRGRLIWESYQTGYDDHPYKTGVIGWQEDLDRMKYEDAIAFYQTFYAPNRAVVSISGDFSVPEALKLLHAHFGNFRSTPFEEPQIPQERLIRPDRRRVVNMKTESVYLTDTVFSDSMKAPTIPAQILMCHLILDDSLGLLQEELVQTGIAKHVSGDCSGATDPDLSGFIITGNPGVSLEKIEKAYDRALEKFPKWVNRERVQSLKLYYLRSMLESLRDPLELAKDFGVNQTLLQDPLRSFMLIEKVQKMTLEDIQESWRAWQRKSKTRLILKPSEKTDPFKKVLGGKVVRS